MSVDLAKLLETQQDTNRLLKLLIRAVLMAADPPSPLLSKPNLRVISDKNFTAAQLVIQPGASLTVLDLPEKPDTDVNVHFVVASSTINSQKVRHSISASPKVGKSSPFSFNATQLELAAAGFTSPNSYPLWTPLAAGVAGTFTVVAGEGFQVAAALHNRVQIILKNEDSAAATIQANGLFIVVYEYDQATMNLFAEVLGDTDPDNQALITESVRRVREIPP